MRVILGFILVGDIGADANLRTFIPFGIVFCKAEQFGSFSAIVIPIDVDSRKVVVLIDNGPKVASVRKGKCNCRLQRPIVVKLVCICQ